MFLIELDLLRGVDSYHNSRLGLLASVLSSQCMTGVPSQLSSGARRILFTCYL